MAGIRIPNLPTATSPNSSDVFPIVNNNLTKQVSFFNAATSLGVLLTNTIVAPATAQTQIVSANVDINGVTFSFNKFDPALGTLNSVTFTILSSVDSNYFNVRNNSSSSLSVKNPKDYLTVYDNQGSGADYNGANTLYVTTPTTGTVGCVIAGNSSQTFTVTPKSLIGSNAVITDLTTYATLYTGSGNVTFNVVIAPNATISGGSASVNMTTVTNTTTLQLTYTYTPVINSLIFNSYILVPVSDNIITNGTNLLNAYQAATTLTPNTSALSSTNRATVIMMPGVYNLNTSTLTMSAEYVDLIGFTKDPSHVVISTNNSNGTIRQTADNVRCIGFTLNNTLYMIESGNPDTGYVQYPAWNPDSNLSLTYWENVIFSAINHQGILSGTFKNCQSSNYAEDGWAFGGDCSGTFIDCIGKSYNQGSGSTRGGGGFGATASGKFTGCTGYNDCLWGGGFVADGGNASGTFINCIGTNVARGGGGFVGASQFDAAVITGMFINCKGVDTSGSTAGGFVGPAYNGSYVTGTFINCIGSSKYGGGFFSKNVDVSSTSILTNCTGTVDYSSSASLRPAGFHSGIEVGFLDVDNNSSYVGGTYFNCIGYTGKISGTNNNNGIVGLGTSFSGRFISGTTNDTVLPKLLYSGTGSRPCYITVLNGNGQLVNGSA